MPQVHLSELRDPNMPVAPRFGFQAPEEGKKKKKGRKKEAPSCHANEKPAIIILPIYSNDCFGYNKIPKIYIVWLRVLFREVHGSLDEIVLFKGFFLKKFF